MDQKRIKNRELFLCGKKKPDVCIVSLVIAQDENMMQEKIRYIENATKNMAVSFATIKVEHPNEEVSPWIAPAVFGNEMFGNGAESFLKEIEEDYLPIINEYFEIDKGKEKYILEGYSMTALFALWAGYNTDLFYGIAAPSPSVWFPNWDKYIEQHTMKAKKVYLSLGEKEDRTKNNVIKIVSMKIKKQKEILDTQIGTCNCKLEWNPGNHFDEIINRQAKGCIWILNEIKE